MYLLRNMFRGAENLYQKIENLVLAIIVVERKLRPYFHGYKIFVKTNYPIRQVLKKLDLARRMVSWAVDFSEYII